MSQPIHHHHQTFLHYTPPVQHHPPPPQHQHQQLNVTHLIPTDTQTQPGQGHQQPTVAPVASTSASANGPLVAKGDWTKDLVQLAKTAELKKHALTLQLHTAHILSAHASLEQKSKGIQDLLEQKNRLESERLRLLNSLREVNEDRDRVDLRESQLQKECNDTRAKIDQLTNGDYAIAKADVDRLRVELGQPPMPSLHETLEERRSQYLTERRLNGNVPQVQASSSTPVAPPDVVVTIPVVPKRPATSSNSFQEGQSKRPRGRPKGSKNKSKTSSMDATVPTS